MTTKLLKPVFRECVDTTIREGSRHRALIAGLTPGDVITIRPKGTRRAELLPIAHCYHVAVRLRVANELAEKRAKRKSRS